VIDRVRFLSRRIANVNKRVNGKLLEMFRNCKVMLGDFPRSIHSAAVIPHAREKGNEPD